ncbi:MAG: 4Fe-4S binding protein [Actinomycetia bacterium]|nr:4Fe-4S binding protein [Actinomycetes bacterium]
MLCNYCKKCEEFCKFNAIAIFEEQKLVFPELCHNCGGCKLVCPQNAIFERDVTIGKIEKGNSNGIEFIHGILDVSQPSAVPVIKKLKKFINSEKNTTVIIDAPPGTSCAMMEAVEESDYCILVTEPTPFGLNDLRLAVDVVRELNVNFGVIINRSDIGNNSVKEYCMKENIEILMEIPHSRKIAEAYSKGINLIDALPEYRGKFNSMLEKIS